MRSPWRSLRKWRDGRSSARIAGLIVVAIAGVFAWTALAGGTEPNDSYQSAVAADGPAAQYRFDDAAGSSTLVDSAGSDTASNSGIVLGGEGPFNGSKSGTFGGSAYATLSSNPLSGASEFTFEAWVDWTGGASYNQAIFDLGAGSSTFISLTPASSASGHKMTFEMTSAGSTLASVAAAKLPSGSWRYVTVTEGGGKLTLYVNAEQVAQSTTSFNPSSLGSLANDYLGKSHASAEPLFNGSLTDVAFYRTGLSASRVEAHYKAAEKAVNVSTPTISGTPKDGNTLTAKDGTWTGLTPIDFTYQWLRCNASGGECSNVGSPTSEPKRQVAHEDVGRTLRVAVTGTNSAGSGTATSPQTTVVEAQKPSNTVLPAISGTAAVGRPLKVSEGTWEGTTPFSFTYQWQSCGSAGTSCKNISGATSSTYTIPSTLLGKTIRATVTATNGGGSSNANTSVTAEVTPGAPYDSALPTISGIARDGQTLTGATGTWSGTEPITYAYQWQRCNSAGEACADVSGATGSTFALTPSDVGATLRFVVTAKNSVGSTSASSAPTAPVAAIPPSNTAAPTVSGTPTDGQTLTASSGTWSGTPAITYAYQWLRCNPAGESCSEIAGATSSSYGIGHSDAGSTLRVRVTGTNAGGSSAASSAASAQVQALAPASTASPSVSGTATDGQTLSTSSGTWSGTPPITYAYQWERCDASGAGCTDISGASGSSYALTHGDVGSTLRARVTATNAAGSAQSTSAASPVVSAQPPSNLVEPTVSGTASDGQTLSANAGEWRGTPPIAFAYQWQRCNVGGGECVDISGATASTYELVPDDVGNRVRVAVTASNAAGSDTNYSPPSSLVYAASPVNTSAPTIAGYALTGQTLSAGHGGWSGTPTISYAYQWQSCNALGEGCMDIPGASGSSYLLQPTDLGTTVRLLVTASNLGGSSSASSAATPTVASGSLALRYSSQFGSEGSGEGQFSHPGQVVLSKGHLWVIDENNNRVEEFGEAGEFIRAFGSAGSGDGQLNSPEGLAVDSAGHVWVADTGNKRIEEFSEAGAFIRAAGEEELGFDEGIAVDNHDRVWVSDTYQGQLLVYANDGTFLKVVSSKGSEAGQLEEPEGLAVDSSGHVWVADWQHRVAEFGESGEYLRQVDVQGSGDGELTTPFGIATDGEGNVWVAETATNRVQVFNASAESLGEVGFTGSEPGEFELSFPVGLAVGPAGDLWVADSGNNRVERFSPGEPEAPSSTSPPSISGEEREGATLTVYHGKWSGSQPIFYSYQWWRCNGAGEECAPIPGAAKPEHQLEASDAGATFFVEVRARNLVSTASARSGTSGVILSGEAPANTSPPSIGGAAVQGETLTVSTGTWSGTEPISYAYQWQRCNPEGGECAPISEATESHYELQVADVGSTIRVLVTASNGAGSASASSEPSAVVTTSEPPRNLTPPTISGTARDGQTLAASTGSWEGTEPISYDYQWERCDTFGAACSDIEGAVASSYELSSADIGTTLRVRVRASNSAGSGTSTSEASEVVSAVAPFNIEAPTIEGVEEDGQTLTARAGAWGGSSPLTYSYQWQRCDGSGEECADIPGATGETYALHPADIGTTLLVVVTASNSAGSAASGSTSTGVIAGSPPRNTVRPAISGSAEPGQTLSVSTGTWTGTPPFTYSYQWERCNAEGEECAKVLGAEGPDYEFTVADAGSSLRVVVTASNEAGESSVTVAANGAPLVNTSAPGVLGSARVGETLSALDGAWSGGLPIDYAYQWQRCDSGGESCVDLEGATGAEYIPAEGDVGSTIRVLVTASNFEGSVAAASSSTTLVALAGLHDVAAPSISGELQSGQVLTVAPGTWGGTGSEPISYAYRWERCDPEGEECAAIAGAEASTYTLAGADVGQTLQVLVSATSGSESASATSVRSGVVGQAHPANTIPPTITGTPNAGQVLEADPGSWTGNGLTFAYQWEQCNALGNSCHPVSGGNGAEFGVPFSFIGKTARVVVSAENAQGSIAVVSAPTPVIGSFSGLVNRVAPSIVGAPQVGNPLAAEPGDWSGEGAISYSYQWQRCDEAEITCANIPGATGTTYTPVAGDAGMIVKVLVTASDQDGPASASSPATPAVAEALDPAIAEAPRIAGSPEEGQVLSASPGSWLSAGEATYAYQWLSCDESGADCSDLPGATSSSLTVTDTLLGQALRVRVSASNAHGTTAALSEATAPAFATLANVARPSIGQGGTQEPVLTATQGLWTSSGTLSFAYRWMRCDVHGEGCLAIPGASASSYVIGGEDLGAHTLRVAVTATRGSRGVTVESDPLAPSAPSAGVWIAGPASVGGTLSAEAAGSGPYTYQWRRCDEAGAACADIEGASSRTYLLGEADVGSSLRVVLTPSGGGESITSTPVWIGKPVRPGGPVTIEHEGSQLAEGLTLSVAPGGIGGSEPIAQGYQWERCDAGGAACSDIEGASGSSYALTSEDLESTVRVRASYTNAYGSSTSRSEATEVIGHTAPIALSQPAMSWLGSLEPGTRVSVSEGSWVGDSPISFEYQWELCDEAGEECSPISGATEAAYVIGEEAAGHTLRASVLAANAPGSTQASAGGAGFGVRSAAGAPSAVERPTISGPAEQGQRLEAAAGTWANAPAGTTYSYQWFRCRSFRPELEGPAEGFVEGRSCSEIAGATGRTRVATFADVEATLMVRVTATNPSELSGSSLSAQTSPVLAGPPEAVRLPRITGEAVAGNTLHLTAGGWEGLEAGSSSTDRWQLCDSEGAGCSPIPGATGTGYKLPTSAIGSTVRVSETAFGPGGSTTAISKASAVVAAPSATSNTSAPTISGSAVDGASLTATNGSWSGSPEIRYAYAWQRCSSSGESCVAIAGATQSVYKAAREDVGHTLVVIVTATNGAGAHSASSTRTGVVAAAGAPVAAIEPKLALFGLAAYGQPISLEQGSWSGDPDIVDQWQRCDPTNLESHGLPTCADIPGATGMLYVPTTADIGYRLRVSETAGNSAGTVVKNTGMTAEAVGLGEAGDEGDSYEGIAVVGHAITAKSGLQTIPAGLPTATEFTFRRSGGTIVQSGPSPRYVLGEGDVGSEIEVLIRTVVKAPGNGLQVYEGTSFVTTAAVKGMLTDRAIPTTSGGYAAGALLTAGNGRWSSSGSPTTFTYQWEGCDSAGQGCAPIAGATNESYEPTASEVGERLRARVSADDGADWGTEVSEPTPVIASPSPPVNEAPPTISGSPAEGQTLTATTGAWSAVGPIAYSYQWRICFEAGTPCSAIAGAESATYSPGGGDVGGTLQVEVTARAETGSVIAASVATPAIAASPAPVNTATPTVALIGPANTEAILKAGAGTWENLDREGTQAIEYQWERCNPASGACTEIAGASSEIYDANIADAGSRLRVQVTAGNDSGKVSSYSLQTATLSGSNASARRALAYVEGEALEVASSSGSQNRAVLTCAQLAAVTGEEHCAFSHPAISPNGQMIAVEVRPRSGASSCPSGTVCPDADNSPTAHVVLLNIDGTEVRALPMQGGQPTWFPDGTRLVTVHTSEGIGGTLVSQLEQVDLADPATATPIEEPEGVVSAQSPSFSPAGGALLYTGKDAMTGKWNLFIAGPELSGASEVELPGLEQIDDPQALALEGEGEGAREIVFSAVDAGEEASPEYGGTKPRSIYIASTDGSGIKRITPAGTDFSAPRMGSSRGGVIATRSAAAGGGAPSRSISEVPLSGAEPRAITTPGREPTEATPPAPSTLYTPEPPSGEPTAHAAGATYDSLAREFEPALYVDVSDGFLPISEDWMFKLEEPGSKGFHRSLLCSSKCKKVGPEAFLGPFGSGKVKYPAEDNPVQQELQTVNSIFWWTASGFNKKTPGQQLLFDTQYRDEAQLNERHVYYALVHRHGMLTIDYWYYYTYNYFNSRGTNCQAPHPGEGYPCGGLAHDLHEGDWENLEVVLNHTRVGNYPQSPYRATQYLISQHGHMHDLPLSQAQLLNGHVAVSAAHGDHAIYPVCKRHGDGTYEETTLLHGIPISLPVIGSLAFYDHVCTEHNWRLGNVSPELGEYLVGAGSLLPENLASKRDIEKFSCWKGLFGYEQSTGIAGTGLASFAWGTSPGAPLRQLDKGIDEADSECPESHAS